MISVFVQRGWLPFRESFTIDPSLAIQSLAECIEETNGTAPGKQLLLLDGAQITDPSLIVEGVTVIYFHIEQVTFETPDGQSCTLDVPLDSPINDIVEELRKTEVGKLYDGYMIIPFHGEERIRGHQTLASRGINGPCNILLVQGPSLGRSFLSVPNIPVIERVINRWCKRDLNITNVAAEVTVCRAWSGQMENPWKGLALEEGATVFILYMLTLDWCYGRIGQKGPEGFFPRACVQIINVIRSEVYLGEDSDLPIPSDVPFRPVSHEVADSAQESPAEEVLVLPRFLLADKGDSFIMIELTVQPLSFPGGSSRIDVVIKSCPVPPRRITSLVLELTFRGNQVLDASPKKLRGPQTETTTENLSRGAAALTAGGSFSAANVSFTLTHESARKTESTRRTQEEIDGVTLGHAVRWTLKEDVGEGGRNGIPEQTLSAWLHYQPRLVEYHCLVSHADNLNRLVSKTKIIDGHHRFHVNWS